MDRLATDRPASKKAYRIIDGRSRRVEPTQFEASVLNRLSDMLGVPIEYHPPVPGSKFKKLEFGSPKDRLPTVFPRSSDGEAPRGVVSHFLNQTGKLRIKPGIFTPDGRFTYGGQLYHLDIKDTINLGTDFMDIIELTQKYAQNTPLILIGGTVTLPKNKGEKNTVPFKIRPFGNTDLVAYRIPREVKNERSEPVEMPIYIIDWSEVIKNLNRLQEPVQPGAK